jgi:hypothetical protein
MALTVCFRSIVYEDALTILSYASPYPVSPTRVNKVMSSLVSRSFCVFNDHCNQQKQILSKKNVLHRVTALKSSGAMTLNITITTVRDVNLLVVNAHSVTSFFFALSASHSRSFGLQNTSATLSTDTKPILASNYNRTSNKKLRPITLDQQRISSLGKGTKSQRFCKVLLTPPSAIAKRTKVESKKLRQKTAPQVTPAQAMFMSTGLSSKPIVKVTSPTAATNKATVKSVTNAVISYLHYRGNGGSARNVAGHPTVDITHNSEGSIMVREETTDERVVLLLSLFSLITIRHTITIRMHIEQDSSSIETITIQCPSKVSRRSPFPMWNRCLHARPIRCAKNIPSHRYSYQIRT